VLRRGERLPGFGHAVYQRADPRFGLLLGTVRTGYAGDRRLEVVEEVIGVGRGRTDEVANVDLALGALTWLSGMGHDAGEVVFAVSRTVGWLAHGVEEYAEPPLRFRPRSLPR
jgi:citrate synthase